MLYHKSPHKVTQESFLGRYPLFQRLLQCSAFFSKYHIFLLMLHNRVLLTNMDLLVCRIVIFLSVKFPPCPLVIYNSHEFSDAIIFGFAYTHPYLMGYQDTFQNLSDRHRLSDLYSNHRIAFNFSGVPHPTCCLLPS